MSYRQRGGGGRAQAMDNSAPETFSCDKIILEKLKEAMIKRNGGKKNTLNSFARRFRIMDRGAGGEGGGKKGDGLLNSYEIHVGLKQCGLNVDKKGCEALLHLLDKSGDGHVSFDEFIIGLRGEMNSARKALIKQAFEVLEPVNGVVGMAQIAKRFDPSQDPDVIEGKQTPEEALREFMQQWDGDGNGNITLSEFEDYYENVSASIDRDDYFELMIRNAWHIAGGTGWSANTSNLRVLVTFTDGSTEVIGITNDLGLDKGNPRAIIMALKKQGVNNIAKVSTAHASEH